MTAPTLTGADQAAVIAAAQQSSQRLRTNLTAFIEALWASFPQYRNREMAEFVAQVVPMVEGAVQQSQSMTSAYLATLAEVAGGSSSPVPTAALTLRDLRNGADPNEVYARPFHLVWRQLHEQQPLDGAKVAAAIKSGLDRATQLAVTDVQLAKTHTARATIMHEPSIVGYRRQLEGAYSCALCIVASTRRYHKADLMPMHPACDCLPVPIRTGETADLVLAPDVLAAAHASIAERFGADSTAARKIRGATKPSGAAVLYRDVLITHEHGELGPVLGVRGADWTGPSAIA